MKKDENNYSVKKKELLDLSGVPCPQNTARILLRLNLMEEKDLLEILIDDGEPVQNVIDSLEVEGYEILSREKIGLKWRIIIKN